MLLSDAPGAVTVNGAVKQEVLLVLNIHVAITNGPNLKGNRLL